MVDKPGRRKRRVVPWGKIVGVVLAVLIVGYAGYYIYQNYIYRAPPEYARIDTTDGAIYIELLPACAPKTVANFVTLVNSGFYNDLVWHRIVPGFVIQTGDPTTRGGNYSTRANWGTGGSNQTVPLEVSKCPGIGNYEGYIAMAREGNQTSGLNTGTSQFFINLSNSTGNVNLNGYYTVFGKVIQGMSVVNAIANSPLCSSSTCSSSFPSGEPFPAVFVTDIVMQSGPPSGSGS